MAQLTDAGQLRDTVAFLADGRLFAKRGTAPAREVPCTFADELRERSERLRENRGWNLSSVGESAEALVIGQDTTPRGIDEPTVVAIAPSGLAGELFYGFSTADLAGIVRRPIEPSEEEQRLVHTSGNQLVSLSAPDAEGQIVCGFDDPSGRQNLSVYRLGSPGFAEITEGDSIDSAACWIPGQAGQLVYQSAGIARDPSGRFAGTTPASIERLDITRGELRGLLASGGYDFLAPQATTDGKLYCIRRPNRRSIKQSLQIAARSLFGLPISCARSLFKAKVSTPTPLDDKSPALLDDQNNAQRAKSELRRSGEICSNSAPRSWQLIRTDIDSPAASSAEVVVRGVVAFHVSSEGRILYSDGSAIFSIPPSGGSPELLEEVERTRQIVVLARS